MADGVQGVTSSYSINTILATTASPYNTNQIDPFSDPNGPFANLNLSAEQQQQIQSILSQDANSNGNSTSNTTSQSPTQLFQQVENVLTPQQQATLKSDLETIGSHHHRHHGGSDSSGASDPLSQLNLTSDQQTQINGILSAAKTSGATPASVLTQINSVLTTTQQQQLASLFSRYTSTGATPQGAQQPVTINTSA